MKRIEDAPKDTLQKFMKSWDEVRREIDAGDAWKIDIAVHFFLEGRESALKEVREAREIEIKSSEALRKMPELFLNHTVNPSLAFMQTENKDIKPKRTIVQLISHNGDLRALTSDGRIYRLMEDEFGDESWVRDEDSIPQE